MEKTYSVQARHILSWHVQGMDSGTWNLTRFKTKGGEQTDDEEKIGAAACHCGPPWREPAYAGTDEFSRCGQSVHFG
ncbi:hypothetical protein YWY31_39710 [Paenibacillus illinoisensis]